MSTREFPPGRIFGGSFTVRARIGSTSWATTYAGLAVPRRDVAIKIYEPSVGQRADVLAALERADAIALAMPPHLVLHPLAAARDSESGLFYRVTPLSVHPSLAQLTEVCPLTLDELVVLVRNVARVLTEAHQRGLAHGALKATNVFVGPSPKHAVQLGDFGASVCAAAATAPSPRDLEWLAPEQRAGAPITPATDVFGLALVAYHALTRTSFRFAPDGGPAASASVQARNAGVALPVELDRVFARALAPVPAARHGNPAELADALRAGIEQVGGSAQSGAPLFATAAPAPFQPADASSSPMIAATPAPEGLPVNRRRRVWLVAALAVGLLGTVSAIVWVARTRPGGSATARAAPAPSPSATATATATASAMATATPPTTEMPRAAPVPVATPPVAAPQVPATRAPEELTELTVMCQPSCEYVMIDGKPAKTFPVRVRPGTHGVGVSRSGFFGDWRKVTVKKGEHEIVKFKLLVDSRKKR